MRVETPSRLHFGIMDLSRTFKREYGALGPTIEGGFTIEVQILEKERLSIKAEKRNERDIRKVYEDLKKELDISHGFEVKVEETIPRHVGLGSTTQLTLGTALAMSESSGYDLSTKELARLTGRCRYSAIGTYGFDRGGFIVEGGKKEKEEIPPLTFRGDIPEEWRFVTVSSEDMEGYDEKAEKPIMEDVTVEKGYAEKIAHHVLMGVIPAVRTNDIEEFGHHISKIQRLVGRSFSDYQGGIFHPSIEDIVERLEVLTYGAGQSSWGPSVYGITDREKVPDIKKEMEDWLKEKGGDFDLRVAKPDNSGARIY